MCWAEQEVRCHFSPPRKGGCYGRRGGRRREQQPAFGGIVFISPQWEPVRNSVQQPLIVVQPIVGFDQTVAFHLRRLIGRHVLNIHSNLAASMTCQLQG